jgi:hypothetical protein
MTDTLDINSVVLSILDPLVAGVLLLVTGTSIVNFVLRHEKLGKLLYQSDLAFTKAMKLSIQLNIGIIVFYSLLVLLSGLADVLKFQVPRSITFLSGFALWLVGITWQICQRTEIRSQGLWCRGSAFRWENILDYRWNDPQDTVLIHLAKDRNFFSGHQGGEFVIPVRECDLEEVATYFKIYLEGKEKLDSPSN